MPLISSLAASVPASGIRRIFEVSSQLADVIDLSVGEPNGAVSPHILRAGSDAWLDDDTGYTPNSGMAELRSAVVAKLRRDNGYAVTGDQVHVTAGGSQALHLAMCLALSPGDEILVPDPGYATFSMAPRLVGAVPVPYRLSPANGFRPVMRELRGRSTARTRAIIVNTPSNPLGVVLGAGDLAAILDFARERDLWVISDEVYECLTFDEPHISLAALDTDERVLGVYSLSKTYGLTGARVGYLAAPAALAERVRTLQESVASCVNTPAQRAAVAALTGDQSDVAAAREHYRANVAAACSALEAEGLAHQRPAAAFYLWVDVSHASDGDVASWALRFLSERKVAVAPGTAFGAAGEGWIRLCAAGDTEPLLTAIERLPRP